MKKADNFDAKQWLTENKITTQSRLNENKDPDSVVSQEARDMFYNAVAKVMKDLYQADIMDNDIIDDYLGTEGGLLGDAIEAFLHPEDLDESRLNESTLKIYRYDPSSYKLKDVKTKKYPSQEEAKQAAVAHNWQVAWDNGDTDLSKEEYINKYSWEDLDSLAYNTYGYEIK